MMRKTLLLINVLLLFVAAGPVAAIQAQWVSSAVSFAAGGVGGVCSVIVGHPVDLVKVREQTSKSTEKTKGTLATLQDIIQEEGIRGMYRGVSAPMVAVAPIWATSFWGFDTGQKLIRHFASLPKDVPLNVLQLCLAGGFSAFPTALVMVPCERIKCLLQTQSHQPQENKKKDQRYYSGFRDCAAHLYREAGLWGLYKGTALTLMRDVPGNMVYFAVYEVCKRALGNSPAAALIAGAMAGIGFWPVVLPMDVLKSRFQTGNYKNIGEVFSELVNEEAGAAGFFRGIRPAMLRSAPANAVSFLGAEMTKSLLLAF